MNLENLARRAFAVVAVTTTLAAAGNAEAHSTVPTHSQNTATVRATTSVATAPRSPMAMPGKFNVKPARLAPSSNGGRTINKYLVQRATSAKGPWKTMAAPPDRAYRAGRLHNGARYYFRIAADNAAGWGRYSKLVTADPQTVPTAPRSPTATPGNTTVKAAWLASFADRDLSASSAVRSEGGELTTTGASTWWLLITGGLLVSVAIGLRLVEAWRRKR